MKKLLLIITAFWAIDCSAQTAPSTVEELGSYISANAPLAESGKLQWSDFYKHIFAGLSALNASGDMLDRENRLIRYSELYEAGKIDKSEFDYRRRMIQVEAASASHAARNAEQAQREIDQQAVEAREQQRSNNVLAAAAQLLQASGPRTLQQIQQTQPVSMLQAQSINGNVRTCQYWNGRIITMTATTWCPNQIQ